MSNAGARSSLDLHTLECFDTLVREGSVSRAADRMGMSQSSASEVLARLRDRFSDPLLVRTREGMVPTRRAQDLLPRVRTAIEQLRGLQDGADRFDPLSAQEQFRITTSDYMQLLLMPRLAGIVRTQAPRCTLDIVPIPIQRTELALETAEIDLTIAYHPQPPAGLRRSPLLRDRLVFIARRDHPEMEKGVDAAQFANLPQVSVAPSGLNYFGSLVDSALAAQGLQRRIAFTSPQFMLSAHLVSHSDMVLSLPRLAAIALAELFPVQVIELPFTTRPIDIALYWHERAHHAPAHLWLRDTVRAALPPGTEVMVH
ncbi:LysR family transcriptional regulator [Hydrogenophaga laconesensis]|uniref:DNA-binding transcriptional LysR family regulator n=1 Tax=Hydrogenophaga laconesensis TaxID=1805971 RepID=A0ABU1VHG9_9BURK|nr:LysR family transcriptional regulator [Hydrogenophaga laconesensis]MDR7096932.1 DNA-binding transcriptional LysR family regulator [Hydrogenophaga laconesensis]